jgi:CubicO group peptidase (beta-lactamase class C family)
MNQRSHKGPRPRFVSRTAASIGAGGLALLVVSSAHAQHNACVQAIVNANAPSAPSSVVPGFVIGVTNGCGLSDIYYFGTSNLATNAPFTATTIMGIASMTKPFTATLVKEYATGGFASPLGHAVSLTDSANDYLPASFLPNDKAAITLGQLINYTSGLPRDDSATAVDALLSQYDAATLGPPGYSNFGYNMLGRLMEPLPFFVGLQTTFPPTYEDQIVSNVLSPLGLADTNFFESEDGTARFSASQIARMAPGYSCSTNPCRPYAIGADSGPMYNPAGGLRSTPHDLMAWLQYQIGLGRPPEAVRRAIAATHEDPQPWGTDLATVPQGWHYKSGSDPGFESFMAFNPEKQLGVFVIGNSDQFSPKVPLGLDIVDALDTSACMTQTCGTNTCQTASNEYGIVADVTWGFAPSNVQTWWTANGCHTSPVSSDPCVTAAEEYAIAANVTWGFAPPNVQTWWTANGCDTSYTGTPCQIAADEYAIAANVTWGFAPSNVQTWWTANGCDASYVGDGCQYTANQYGIVANVTWGFAPPNVQAWWRANNCNAGAEPWALP